MPNNRCKAGLLIFDLDGTLVDTRRDLANAVNYALQQLGKEELEVGTITRYVGDGVRKLLERVLGNAADDELETVSLLFHQYYEDHLADFSQPYPGILDMLDYFHHKKKAILTNKPQEFTESLLRRLGLYHDFDVVIGGRPNLNLKPDPQPVRFILQRLDMPPASAMIIGDGENDILAGKAAGITTCAVTYGFRPAEKLLALQPDFVVHDPAELKRIIV